MLVSWWIATNTLMILGAMVAVLLATSSWRRPVPGSAWFALTMLAIGVLEALWVCVNLSDGLAAKIIWTKLEYPSISAIGMLVFSFVCAYTGQGRGLSGSRVAFLWVLPVTFVVLALTNDYHGLMWHRAVLSPDGSSAPLHVDWGVAAWALVAFNYVLLMIAITVLVRWARHAQRVYRRQVAVLIASIMVAVISRGFYTMRWIPEPGLDLLPLVFTLSGALVYLALFRYRLLDLVPVARETLIESMVDGVIVVDARGRIVDSNPAAHRLLSQSSASLAGHSVREVLGPAADGLDDPNRHATAGFEMAAPADSHLHVEVQIIPLCLRQAGGGTLLVVRDITARWLAEQELRAQLEANVALQAVLRQEATRDSLTGLFNRRFLEETLVREVALASRDHASMALTVIDLDNFKSVNDQFGHQVGDRVLKAVADLLQAGTRTGDVVCRYGGEEFVVVMPKATADDAGARAEQWRSTVASLRLEHDGSAIAVTFSAGVAAYPSSGSDGDEVFRSADRALYEAKRAGRNRVSTAEGSVSGAQSTVGHTIPSHDEA